MRYVAVFFLVGYAAARCPIGTIQGVSDSDCYVYHSKPELWFKADEACMNRGGHLASISGKLMNSILAKISDHYCASEHWLGAGWNTEADNKWVWTDDTRFQFTNWAAGNPTSQGTLCLAQDANSGLWYSKPCREAKAYICRIPGLRPGASTQPLLYTTVSPGAATRPQCPACPTCSTVGSTADTDYSTTTAQGGWVRNPATGKCYKFMSRGYTNASVAQQDCEDVSGTLPSIHSMAENEWIADFYRSRTSGVAGVWGDIMLGLNKNASSWNWYDGSPYDFVNWAEYEPREWANYATLHESYGVIGQWVGDHGDLFYLSFLCQVSSC